MLHNVSELKAGFDAQESLRKMLNIRELVMEVSREVRLTITLLVQIDFKQSLMHHVVQGVREAADLFLLGHALLSVLHCINGEVQAFHSDLAVLMMLKVGLIDKLTHFTKLSVHLIGVASEYNQADPCPSQSKHALEELHLTLGVDMTFILQMVPIVLEDLGQQLIGVQIPKGC